MSVESKKAIVRQTHEAVSHHDLDAAGQYQNPARAERWPADKRGLQALFTACPGCRWELEDLVAEGDKVAVRDTFRGTHPGAFMGVPPTGTQAHAATRRHPCARGGRAVSRVAFVVGERRTDRAGRGGPPGINIRPECDSHYPRAPEPLCPVSNLTRQARVKRTT